MTERILVVDDHPLTRDALASLLTQGGFDVVGEAADGVEALDLALELQPDLVLLDLSMPGLDGLAALPRLRTAAPGCEVVVLTASGTEENLLAAIRAGAAGYVLKQAGGQDVIRALEAVAQGHSLLDPALTERVFAEVRRAARAQEVSAFSPLTEQERRVLALVADGKTNREIAQELHLGEGTVRNYVSNILGKLGVSNRAEAAAYATKHNLKDAI